MKQAQVAEATRKLLAAMWERNLPIVRERVEEMEQTAAAAQARRLTSEERHQAGGTAHKLAGSLGTFGYHRGTDIARELELMLEAEGEIDAVRLAELAGELRQHLGL